MYKSGSVLFDVELPIFARSLNDPGRFAVKACQDILVFQVRIEVADAAKGVKLSWKSRVVNLM
jgi:hypothetical protein